VVAEEIYPADVAFVELFEIGEDCARIKVMLEIFEGRARSARRRAEKREGGEYSHIRRERNAGDSGSLLPGWLSGITGWTRRARTELCRSCRCAREETSCERIKRDKSMEFA